MLIDKSTIGCAYRYTLDQKDDWNKYVENATEYDFFHTWKYHKLANSGEPVLFVYTEGDKYIAFPLLHRPIPGTPYFDLHCVYGYTGPISNRYFEELEEHFMQNFKDAFLTFLKEGNYVSVFSKLHPFFGHSRLMNKFGGLHDNGKTIAIDLTQSLDEQRRKYRKTTKGDINRCRRFGYQVKKAETKEDVLAFSRLYEQNMGRINASEFYLFNEDYFLELLTNEKNCELMLVISNGEVICGSIIMYANKIMEGYLISTQTEYLKYSPAKFLLDEISLIGRSKGIDYYHLGGGLGFKENSLFEWKLGFSDFILDYKTWRYIANQEVYDHLVKESGNEWVEEVDFFPLYRMSPSVS